MVPWELVEVKDSSARREYWCACCSSGMGLVALLDLDGPWGPFQPSHSVILFQKWMDELLSVRADSMCAVSPSWPQSLWKREQGAIHLWQLFGRRCAWLRVPAEQCWLQSAPAFPHNCCPNKSIALGDICFWVKWIHRWVLAVFLLNLSCCPTEFDEQIPWETWAVQWQSMRRAKWLQIKVLHQQMEAGLEHCRNTQFPGWEDEPQP